MNPEQANLVVTVKETQDTVSGLRRIRSTSRPLWLFAVMVMMIAVLTEQAYCAHPRECFASLSTLETVLECPRNDEDWIKRKISKACNGHQQNCSTKDVFQYHCLLDETGTRLVEVCAPVHQIIGKLCAEFNSNGMVIQSRRTASCRDFNVPCPFKYASNTSYKYQECYAYVKSTTLQYTTDAIQHVMFTTINSFQTNTVVTAKVEDTSNRSIMAVIIPVLAILAVLLAILVLVYKIGPKKVKREISNLECLKCYNRLSSHSENDPEEGVPLNEAGPEQSTGEHHKTRGLIFGCSGSGKRTLLSKLGKDPHPSSPVEKEKNGFKSLTVAFVVDESMFCLKGIANPSGGWRSDSDSFHERIFELRICSDQEYLYGYLQICLSKSTIPILLIDASKDLESKISDQRDVFYNWKYLDFYAFYLRMVYEKCGPDAPVVILARQCDEKTLKGSSTFERFQKSFPRELGALLDNSRYVPFNFNEKSILEVEQCIISAIKSLSSLEGKIPMKSKKFENALTDVKNGRKVVGLSELRCLVSENELEMKKMLQFYNNSGSIMYRDEMPLKDIVILDVDWFCNAFHHIISNNSCVAISDDIWQKHGFIHDHVMSSVWEVAELCSTIQYKETVLLYMQKLGLLVKGRDYYYVPSLNRRRYEEKEMKYIEASTHKTPVMIFHFEFLPTIFFSHLAILLFDTKELQTDSTTAIYQNAAFFHLENHEIVIAVSTSNINVQMFTKEQTLEKGMMSRMRNVVQKSLEETIQSFKPLLTYKTALCFSDISVCDEVDDIVFEKELELQTTNIYPIPGFTNWGKREIMKFWFQKED